VLALGVQEVPPLDLFDLVDRQGLGGIEEVWRWQNETGLSVLVPDRVQRMDRGQGRVLSKTHSLLASMASKMIFRRSSEGSDPKLNGFLFVNTFLPI
jgi:hypothetical protein